MIAVASVVLAALGFIAGKYWIGGLMARSSDTAQGPKVIVQSPDKETAGAEQPGATQPPSQAVIKVAQRAPTDAERSEVEQSAPQDGAGLNRSGEGDQNDTSLGMDTKPLDDSTNATKPPVGFTVVAGSYANRTNAEREMANLAAKGYSPSMVRVTSKGQVYNRVLVGTFSTRSEALTIRDQLVADGTPATIVGQ